LTGITGKSCLKFALGNVDLVTAILVRTRFLFVRSVFAMFAMFAPCCRLVGLGLLAFSSGCAMCSSCDDYTYPAYGGRWERLDPCYGRVGSVFTPEVGQRVDGDEYYSPDMQAVPKQSESQKPTESTPAEGSTIEGTPAEPMPNESMPNETAPSETIPSETIPSETVPSETAPSEGQVPAEDAAPQPRSLIPQARSKQGRPLDASVLRQPARPRR
jgi:hypothetical protein